MDEFSLIDTFFKYPAQLRDDVIYGIGDDAACVSIPSGQQLLISTDTLVSEVHFLSSWDAYDIACKAVMVNVSDMAAMGATPCWLSLALTLPELNTSWLQRFSQGLHDSLNQFNIALIGGDTTRGPLSMTLTIHGLAPTGKAVRRNGAHTGDKIYVSGELGAAALAVYFLQRNDINVEDRQVLMQKLQHPKPRIDLGEVLREYASAAIDISDGLSADLNHICTSSEVGACLISERIPVHPLVKKYQQENATSFSLTGGDDYEICFTVAPENEQRFITSLNHLNLNCYRIGTIESKLGLRIITRGEEEVFVPRGYSHF
ncbi:thiamine-phosphate kinase [Legionella hackeliae]|uniref:Thiamine-monophosphate kinase n=1 Tax=Legionella hackeliae TaxID=449 RepID=A0A0A8UUZ3_LEGHA|nr:thiamine-phosphate kinase [Legionella hackeliae]KTD15291.1 thiamine monophosphate kinase (AIR synthase) [Legionella hackeliae]CEK11341.1 Thiamine-monophosphate kinase [Legionella hackeliae]STX48113.1 thiamine monophosphate kinase (AIR synthase) [Legionella hackeliae]